MPYPSARPPEGVNPYEEDPLPGASREDLPAAVTPPGYPAGPPVARPVPAPGHSAPAAHYPRGAVAEKNGPGTGSLVTGILSIVMCALVVIGVALGIVAVVLGIKGMRYAAEGRANNGGVAKAGLITGAIGIFIGLFGWGLIFLGALYSG